MTVLPALTRCCIIGTQSDSDELSPEEAQAVKIPEMAVNLFRAWVKREQRMNVDNEFANKAKVQLTLDIVGLIRVSTRRFEECAGIR